MISVEAFLPDLYADVEGVPEPLATSRVIDAAIAFADKSDYVRRDIKIALAPNVESYLITPADPNEVIASITDIYFDCHPLELVSERELDRQHCGWDCYVGCPHYAVVEASAAPMTVRFMPRLNTSTESGTIGSATATNPVVVISTAHGLTTGRRVAFCDGTFENQNHLVTVVDANTFSLDGVDGTALTSISGSWASASTDAYAQVSVKPKRGTATEVDDELYEEWKEPILAYAKAKLYAMPNKAWSAPEYVAPMLAMYEQGVKQARFKRKEGRFDRSTPLTVPPAPTMRYGYVARGRRFHAYHW